MSDNGANLALIWGQTLKLFEYDGYSIVSSIRPAWNSENRILYVRGSDKDYNNSVIKMPVEYWKNVRISFERSWNLNMPRFN